MSRRIGIISGKKGLFISSSMVSSVAFHPAGTIIASASTDKSIKLFDIRMHKLIQHYGDAHGATNAEGVSASGVNSIQTNL